MTKSYGSLRAVADMTFQVEHGEIFALLGPNGAGKTTTVEILEGYRRRDGGRVSVMGVDPNSPTADWRAGIGIVLQSAGIEPELTVSECLHRFGCYYESHWQVSDLLRLVGLSHKSGARIGRLSGGERRRVDFAIALVGRPDLLFLDEPTTGFDPGARREAWGILTDLAASGTTVFLTTHYMDEAEVLADHIAIMFQGRIVASGRWNELPGADTTEVHFRLESDALVAQLPSNLAGKASSKGHDIVFTTATPEEDIHLLTSWATENRWRLINLRVRPASLEDIYLRLAHQYATEHRRSPG